MFISYGKPYYVTSKDALAQWVKEIMRESGISTGIYQSHSTRAVLNTMVYKSCVLLQVVLKRSQCSSGYTFFSYYYRGMTTKCQKANKVCTQTLIIRALKYKCKVFRVQNMEFSVTQRFV